MLWQICISLPKPILYSDQRGLVLPRRQCVLVDPKLLWQVRLFIFVSMRACTIFPVIRISGNDRSCKNDHRLFFFFTWIYRNGFWGGSKWMRREFGSFISISLLSFSHAKADWVIWDMSSFHYLLSRGK